METGLITARSIIGGFTSPKSKIIVKMGKKGYLICVDDSIYVPRMEHRSYYLYDIDTAELVVSTANTLSALMRP